VNSIEVDGARAVCQVLESCGALETIYMVSETAESEAKPSFTVLNPRALASRQAYPPVRTSKYSCLLDLCPRVMLTSKYSSENNTG
jgi:hypothetical protein